MQIHWSWFELLELNTTCASHFVAARHLNQGTVINHIILLQNRWDESVILLLAQVVITDSVSGCLAAETVIRLEVEGESDNLLYSFFEHHKIYT